MDKVELFVNGKIYSGFTSVDITRALNALSGSFSLGITDRWSGQSEPWIVAPDDECEVKINASTVIKGYIFAVETSVNKSSRSIQISGRDKTADFVDCSIDIKENQIQKISLKSLAQLFARPFGLSVTVDGPQGALFNPFAINPGETGFEALERACRQRGLLLTNDGNGGVLITRPVTRVRSSTIIEEGENLLQGAAKFDHSERFSQYRVKGQHSKFEEDLDPMFSYAIIGSAKDSEVGRYRPMLIVNESLTTIEGARTRAQWEATNRAAKASSFRAQVQGWTKGDGTLWRVNELIRFRAKSLGIDDDLLCVGTKMTLQSGAGSLTELQLERKDAYIPEPEIPKETSPLETAIKKEIAP